MNRTTRAAAVVALALVGGIVFSSNAAAAPDAEAAKALARQNNCFKCHGTDKAKDGPSLKSISEKYKGQGDAEAKLTKHLTSGEMAKFPDGHTEEHKKVEGDAAGLKNLIDWILSL